MTDVDVLRGETVKVGDTEPSLRLQCLNSVGEPYNLEGYSATLKLRRTDSDTNAVDTSATLEQPERGIIEYSWSSGDTDESGVFSGEVSATSNNDTITFPNIGFFEVYVEEGL